ncbi:MAG TPA: ATP-binding protein [Pirellulales bacterium]
MSLSHYQADFDYCLQRAAALLCGPVRAIDFDWEPTKLLRKRLKVEARIGLSGSDPLVSLGSEKQPRLQVGLEVCSLRIGQQTVPLVQVVLPYLPKANTPGDFWVAQQADVPLIAKYIRRLSRNAVRSRPPIMAEEDRRRLWQNTVGFLRSPREPFRHFGISKRRGVLLLGAPGNGKTMACRWLGGECRRNGLKWRNVSVQLYRKAREENSLGELFHLDRPGVVLFDDFDLGIRDRQQAGPNEDHSTFLSELDGMASRCGVVFLFTSNARLRELDPAFRRPGRIDVIMEFRPPDAGLRRRFIEECWQGEIATSLDVDRIIEATEGLSFADLEELRKLLALDYLETGDWDWDRAWQTFNAGRGPSNTKPIGFGKPGPSQPEESGVIKRELLEAKRRG